MSLITNTNLTSAREALIEAAKAELDQAAANATRNSQPAPAPSVLRTASNPLLDWAKLNPAVASQTGADMNPAKLRNLAEKLDGIDTKVAQSAADRFLTGAFGSATPGQASAGSLLDAIQTSATSSSRNPLANSTLDNFRGSGQGALMDDPPADQGAGASGGSDASKSSSAWDAVKNFFGGVVGMILGGAGTTTPAGAVAGSTAGAAAGTAFGVLTANTGSPEDKKNEANGIIGVFRQGKTGTTNANEAEQLKLVDYGGTPVPEDVDNGGSGPHYVTRDMINAIAARKGAKGQPTPDDAGDTSTGPINTGADGTGKLGSLSQPINGDETASRVHTVTAADKIALQARITSKITLIH